ncbi:MAG TPA: hypothetical protein VHM90_19140 [Phycisphaerae bacterium]|nr:hypothetical protein [Phycisphaerae bacterium]
MANIVHVCQGCGRNVPAKYCEFTQGIGMLVLRTQRGVKGNMCKQCASKYFWELTGLTLLTGWWGVISFITNIVFIISNITYFIGSRSLPEPGRAFPVETAAVVPPVQAGAPEPHPLAAHRNDIVLRLRGGQTPVQIGQYIASQTGVPAAHAEEYARAVQEGWG